jgi:hypothetical protein
MPVDFGEADIRSNIFDITHCCPIRYFRFEKPSWIRLEKVPGSSSKAFGQEAQRNNKCTTWVGRQYREIVDTK